MSDPVSPTYTCYDPEGEASVATALLDVVEDLGLLASTPGSLSTSKAYVVAGDLDTSLPNFPYQHTGDVAPQFVTKSGAGTRLFQPGTNQTCIAASIFGMPLKRDLSLIPASIRRQHRFVWDTVLSRTVPVLAANKLSLGLQDDMIEFSIAGGGIILLSQSSLNAGAWTLQFRPTNGAGITTGPSSGVVPDGTPQHFRWEYFDIYPGPHLDISINGSLKFSLTGASMPAFDGNEPLNFTVVSGGAVNTIGQLDHMWFSRFLVELLP